MFGPTLELSQSRLSKPDAPEGIRRQLLTLTRMHPKFFLMVEWKSPTKSRVFPASPQNQVEPKLLWILLLTAARAPYLVLAPQSIEPGQGQLTSPAVEASSSSHDSCGGGSPCDALIR